MWSTEYDASARYLFGRVPFDLALTTYDVQNSQLNMDSVCSYDYPAHYDDGNSSLPPCLPPETKWENHQQTHHRNPHFVASELNDPICHSDECQMGSFSSEATICALYIVSFVLLSGGLSPKNTFRFSSSHIFRHLKLEIALAISASNDEKCIGHLPGIFNTAIMAITTVLVIVVLLASYIRVFHKVASSKAQLQLVSIGGAIYGNQRRRLQIMTQHQKILLCMVVIVISLIVAFSTGSLSILIAKKKHWCKSAHHVNIIGHFVDSWCDE